MLLIQNANIITSTEMLTGHDLAIDDDQIMAIAPSGTILPIPRAQIIDATGLFLTPGLIDLQLNGGFGHDFTLDPTTIWSVAAQLPQYGLTGFLPTIISSPLAVGGQAMEVLAGGSPVDWSGSLPLGLHLEGPYFNPAKKGAHNPAYLRAPNVNDIEAWTTENGVRLVTLAPELPGALEMISALTERHIIVSAGHSLATLSEAEAGFEAGIRYGTHLFNAMPPLHHREPGLPGALLTDDRPMVGLVADGIHVHPRLIQLAWRSLGPARLNLVTDAMAALGMPPGRYQLGDFEVNVDADSARLADGTLAGSILTPDAALRNLMTFTGCTPVEALLTMTRNPARLLGIDRHKGHIAPGFDADLVLFSAAWHVSRTIIGGRIVYQA
jgi:N-acetylglucosamine-6-phosphate deacetylase